MKERLLGNSAYRHRRRRRTVPHTQRGMTLLGFLILVTFLGLFAYAAIRLTPVYLNYLKVVGVVEGVHEEFDGQNPSRTQIRTSIGRRFSVESVTVLQPREIRVSPQDSGFLVEADYHHTTPFIGNVSFTVHFNKSALIRR